MDNETIFEVIDRYKELLDLKDSLAEQTKANNKDIEDVKNKLVNLMVENECPQVARNGYNYYLQSKTIYSKKSEEKLQEAGVNFLEVLRAEGLGDLIQETVNSRTLSSALNNYVEENGQLSEGLEEVISVYDTYEISKRKGKTV